MDGIRFDSLTRQLATSRLSRRAALAGAAGGLMAAIGLRSPASSQVTQADCGNKKCASNPAVCTNGCVCCAYPNGNSRCRPPGTCSPGTVACPPGQVVGPAGVCTAPTTTTTTTTTTAAPCPIGYDAINGGCFRIGNDTCGSCPRGGSIEGSGNYLCVYYLGGSGCQRSADCPTGQACYPPSGQCVVPCP